MEVSEGDAGPPVGLEEEGSSTSIAFAVVVALPSAEEELDSEALDGMCFESPAATTFVVVVLVDVASHSLL